MKKKTKKSSRKKGSTKKMRGDVTRRRLSQLTQQELLTAVRLLPADVVKQIGKRHPLLIPPFTNATLRRAVKDYLAGGARKKGIVDKYGEINNWDVSNVTNMRYLFNNAWSFNQPLNNWNVSNVERMHAIIYQHDDMGKGRLNYFKWKIEPTSKLCLPTKWSVISKKPIGFEFRLRDGPFGGLQLGGDGCETHYVRIIKKTKDVTGATSSITVEGYLGAHDKTGLWSKEKETKKNQN